MLDLARRLVVLAALGSLCFACSNDPEEPAPAADKGLESDMPVEGSSDSWRSPTLHGILNFATANKAEFDGKSFYHSWDFELSDKADVSLTVVPGADNFDTVMYLYQRAEGEHNWGKYIARNDDHAGNAWSEITKSLEKGQFRIMLKGYKKSLRGNFNLKGACAGDGCKKAPAGCEDGMEPWPDSTDPTASCVSRTFEVLTAKALTSASTYVTVEDRCSQHEVIRKAFDYYYRYWDGHGYLEDMFYDDEPIGFSIDFTSFGDKGCFVQLDTGGDETAMDMLFDGKGDLLVYYQHNQSPEVDWSCGVPGEKMPEGDIWPEEFCVGAYLRNTGPMHDEVKDSGTVLSELAGDMLSKLGALTVDKYAGTYGLSGDTELNYDITEWVGTDDGTVALVRVQALDKPEVEYFVGDDGYDMHLFYYTGPDGAVFACDSLD
jgi:hypothetical protein